MESISNILGIDKIDMSGKLILIEEIHDSNANFVLHSVILNALKKKVGICFVLFHNTFNHYHNIGLKLGYNLTMLKDEGKVAIIEPMKIIASGIECMYEKTTHDLDITSSKSNFNINGVHNLFSIIKNKYHEMTKSNESVIIIIDDFSHLYNLGVNLKDSMYFVRHLRSLLEFDNVLQFCFVIHTYKRQLQSCFPNMLLYYLRHIAHLYIVVNPIETGCFSDTHGEITINWKIHHIRKKYNWSKVTKYIYKVLDRQVKIYVPNTLTVLT